MLLPCFVVVVVVLVMTRERRKSTLYNLTS